MSAEQYNPSEPVFTRAEQPNFESWSNATNEHRESIPEREIAFTFIKPGFEDHEQEIIDVIRDSGLEVLYADRIQLSSAAIDLIYKDSSNEHFYPTMRDHLASHEVVMMMVGGHGTDAQDTLSGLKKTKDGKDGVIRMLFQKNERISPEEIALWENGQYPNQDDLTVRLTQSNVIHTADTTDEALNALHLLLGDKFNEMRLRGNLPSELWDFFKPNDQTKDQI